MFEGNCSNEEKLFVHVKEKSKGGQDENLPLVASVQSGDGSVVMDGDGFWAISGSNVGDTVIQFGAGDKQDFFTLHVTAPAVDHFEATTDEPVLK